MSFFPAAFAIVVGIEAGYVNNPADPGGETKYGVSKRAYPNEDIPNMTLDRAQFLFHRDYWIPSGCDKMSWERALCAFDCAINQGEGAEEVINKHSSDATELMTQRAIRYAHSVNFEKFNHSWMHRLFEIFKAAQTTPKES